MRRTSAFALVAVVAACVVPGVAQAATSQQASPTPAPLQWGECPADSGVTTLECATLDVPLDYQDPTGRQIEIMISRLASDNQEQRRGVLLTNPGGPGASGLNFPTDLKDAGLPQSVLDSYDIIGIDPRGVGQSTPVTCDLSLEQQLMGNLPPYAHNAEDVVERAVEVELVAEQCATSETAWMLPHTTTANAARDLDMVRQALGEETASFLGYSYGTHLGAVYTTLFPETSDRVVIDSSLPPNGLDHEAGKLMGPGFEERFPDFAAYAAARPELGLGNTPDEVRAKYFEIAERLDEEPTTELTGALFRIATLSNLARDSHFPTLVELWQQAEAGRPVSVASNPLTLSDTDDLGFDNPLSSHLYVLCGDNEWSRSIESYQDDVEAARKPYPMYGPAAANIRACAFWPEIDRAPVEVDDQGPSNVLLVQNTRDASTPLIGAQQMRDALGDRVRMVTADQGGHGVYLFGTNACANDSVTDYLVTGERVSEDRFCAAE